MSERIAFLPAGVEPCVPFLPLGEAPDGKWGVVNDEPWLAWQGEDPLELLYLSRADYEHAVRRLAPSRILLAITRRRQEYALDLPGQALGTIELEIRSALFLIRDDGDGTTKRSVLLDTLASLTLVPRFRGLDSLDLLDYLRDGDAELIAELDNLAASTTEVHDPDGAERAIRREFAMALGQFAAQRGRVEKAGVLPHHDVERVYLVSPSLPELEDRANKLHDPVYHWRRGMVLPLPAREVPALVARGQKVQVLFPTANEFVGSLIELSPGQLEVELADRSKSPGFAAYLANKRINQALLRTAIRFITAKDQPLANVLAEQAQREAALLGSWLGSSRAEAASARKALLIALGDAALLATLCRRRQDQPSAEAVETLARAVSSVLERER